MTLVEARKKRNEYKGHGTRHCPRSRRFFVNNNIFQTATADAQTHSSSFPLHDLLSNLTINKTDNKSPITHAPHPTSSQMGASAGTKYAIHCRACQVAARSPNPLDRVNLKSDYLSNSDINTAEKPSPSY
ncbi:hypothetical protein VKT23_013521 [Stygiomarasmius scandens]|uniref:Uncharacterized protein n=1 Tax=Marasmiellus scandens TaxID=2682957 RepID=A0ABR1J309_9AGAR